MPKNPKTVICKYCNNPMPVKVRVCPACGAKKKKPVYKRWWFIVLLVILVFGAIGSGGNKFAWKDIELNGVLPEPKSHTGRIVLNSDDHLSLYVQKTTKKDYKDYLTKCQNKGFTIESDKSDTMYSAYNEDGYELSLLYVESKKELDINLDAPMEMHTLEWPTSELVSLLPVPNSTIGVISRDTSDVFFAYIGKICLDNFQSYVNQCIASGFDVNYDKGVKYYLADNESGYHIALRYQGNSIMTIEIERPKSNPGETTLETEDTVSSTEENPATSVPETTPATTTELVTGMRLEFKEAMDSYEAFYDEYCDFMNRYSENPTDLQLLAQYSKMLVKLSEMDEKFEAWEDEDMNDAELKYYLEVSGRITTKLLDVANYS